MIQISTKDHRVICIAAGMLMSLASEKKLSRKHREVIASVGNDLLDIALKVNQEPKPKEQNNAD